MTREAKRGIWSTHGDVNVVVVCGDADVEKIKAVLMEVIGYEPTTVDRTDGEPTVRDIERNLRLAGA